MLWIDRVESRLSGWISRLPYLNVITMVGVALIVVELLAVGSVARAQVERSNEQQASAAALRTRLWQCSESGPAAVADRCRAQVLASVNAGGGTQIARSSRLANWDDRTIYDRNEHRDPQSDVQVAGNMAAGGIVPVSMVRSAR